MTLNSSAKAALSRHWFAVGWEVSLRDAPLATSLLSEPLVLWRDDHDQPVAAIDRCPHRGVALSLGTVDDAGHLVCGYHGWHYEASGRCVKIPQLREGVPIPERARLSLVHCEARYGLLWVCLDSPVSGIPQFPEWDDARYRHVACAAYTWETSAERMVENFTDFGHLGYLHDGLLGSSDDLVVPSHHVEQKGSKLHYELTMNVPNTNVKYAVTDISGEVGRQTNTYVLTLPYTIHLACRYHDSDTHRTLFFSVQPRGDGTCTGYCYQSRDFDLGGKDAPYGAFQEFLALQDRPIVESQTPKDLLFGDHSELHLPFDRVAIAYRRAMTGLIEKGAPAIDVFKKSEFLEGSPREVATS